MKLWRLDAMHELDDVEGAFCLLFREEAEAHHQAARLAAIGWMTDVYSEDVDYLPPLLAARLVGICWPLASTGFFCCELARQLAAEELAQAERREGMLA